MTGNTLNLEGDCFNIGTLNISFIKAAYVFFIIPKKVTLRSFLVNSPCLRVFSKPPKLERALFNMWPEAGKKRGEGRAL